MLKKVAQHTLIYAIGNIGVRAASFLLIPVFTHNLTQPNFGLLATLLMTNQVLLVFMNAGMRDTFVRFFKTSETDRTVGTLLGSCLVVSITAGICSTGVVIAPLNPVFQNLLHTETVTPYLLVTCAFTLCQALCLLLMSYYQTRQRPIAFLVGGVASACLLLGLNLLALVAFDVGVPGVLLAYLAAYGSAFVVLFIHVVSQTGLTFSRAVIRTNLKFGLPLVLLQISTILITALPVFFLSHYHGLETVAVFSVGQKLAQLLVPFLVLPFQQALEPMVFNNLDDEALPEKLSNMLTYFVFAFLVAACGFMAGSRLLLFVAAPGNYSGAGLVMAGLLPATFFLGLANMGRVLLHIDLKTYITGTIAILSAIMSLLLYAVLVKHAAIPGALVAANAVWIFQGGFMLCFGLRTFRIPLDVKRLAITGTLLLAVCGAFMLSTDLAALPFYVTVFALVAAGGLVLRWSGFLTQHEREALNAFRERCRCMLKR